MKDKMLSLEGALRYLKCSGGVFSKHVRPNIPDHGTPRRPRFNTKDIDAWMETQKVEPKARSR